MPIVTAQFNLQTGVAQKIVNADRQQQIAVIHNGDTATSKIIYVGNSGVTIDNGLHIDANNTITLPLDPGSDLWAVGGFNNLLVTTLVIKQD
jgi:hypothetical protein